MAEESKRNDSVVTSASSNSFEQADPNLERALRPKRFPRLH